jgi:hypothetical protein
MASTPICAMSSFPPRSREAEALVGLMMHILTQKVIEGCSIMTVSSTYATRSSIDPARQPSFVRVRDGPRLCALFSALPTNNIFTRASRSREGGGLFTVEIAGKDRPRHVQVCRQAAMSASACLLRRLHWQEGQLALTSPPAAATETKYVDSVCCDESHSADRVACVFARVRKSASIRAWVCVYACARLCHQSMHDDVERKVQTPAAPAHH